MKSMLKRRYRAAFYFSLIIITGALGLYACNDFGLDPNFFKGQVNGEIRISSVVPENTDEIRVALSPDFPPSDFRKLQISEVLPVSKDTSLKSQVVPFSMQVPYGRYDATVVTWKEKNRGLSLSDIVGLHGNIEQFELKSIELNEAHPVEDGVNIGVDLSIVDRTASVQGTVNFVGDWPSNTFVTVFIMLRTLADLSGIPPVLVFIPTNSTEFVINAKVSADTYNLAAVAWLPTGPFDLANVRFLGVFEDPENPGNPAQIVVPDSTNITGLNITADFANINQ